MPRSFFSVHQIFLPCQSICQSCHQLICQVQCVSVSFSLQWFIYSDLGCDIIHIFLSESVDFLTLDTIDFFMLSLFIFCRNIISIVSKFKNNQVQTCKCTTVFSPILPKRSFLLFIIQGRAQ